MVDVIETSVLNQGINQEGKGQREHFELNFTFSVLSYRYTIFIIQADSLKDLIFSKAFKITSVVRYIICFLTNPSEKVTQRRISPEALLHIHSAFCLKQFLHDG